MWPRPDAPLAQRMRPRTLDEFVGQQHILGPGKLLRRAIEADRISSIILFGPPGTGKTTLAEIIASATQSRFERLSGVESNVADHAPRHRGGGQSPREHGRRRRFSSSTRSIASTRRSRMCCCRMSSAARCGSSARRRTILSSTSTARWSRARRSSNSSRYRSKTLSALIRRALADKERGSASMHITHRRRRAAASRHGERWRRAQVRSTRSKLPLVTTPPDAERSDSHHARDRGGEHPEKGRGL